MSDDVVGTLEQRTRERDDARAMHDNLYPALVATCDANAKLVRELQAHREEIAALEDKLETALARVVELEDELLTVAAEKKRAEMIEPWLGHAQVTP